MQETFFPSKVLLFGEYSIIHGSQALAMPYEMFGGELDFPRAGEGSSKSQDSNLELRNFYLYLQQNVDDFHFSIDLMSLDFDIKQGMYFRSSIPQGHGLGSSGALCAALLYRYGSFPQNSPLLGDDLLRLKKQFGQMESFFHEKSSGLDPLISFLKRPLLLQGINDFSFPQLPSKGGQKDKGAIFLLDTGRSRKTGPLVNLYLEKYRHEEFRNLIENELIPCNNRCIQNFLAARWDNLQKDFYQLASFQYAHFLPMIPQILRKGWENGLTNHGFALKLCGGGGGGYLLGMSPDLSLVHKALPDFALRALWRF